MIENIVNQINHLGYKITQDPLNKNTWKIVSPNSSEYCHIDDGLFSLVADNNSISLHKGEKCLCQINNNEDPFLILRHLPANLFANNTALNKTNTIESLYDFCKADTIDKKRLINKILNSKRIDQFKNRRDFAFSVLHSLRDSNINVENKNYDLSIVDIILSIV